MTEQEKLEEAKRLYTTANADQKYVLESLFPELKSKDERIREAVIDFFSEPGRKEYILKGFTVDDILAWLEKQGEQGKQKSADKVEPKFKVGDWIIDVQGVSVNQIVGYEDDSYHIRTSCSEFYLPMKLTEKNYHLWSINDAKPGDVLQLGLVTAIFEKIIGNGNCMCYCSVCSGEFEIPSQDGADNSYGCHNATPATKEQCDLLFSKMKEAGYEWDAEKKELKKVEQSIDIPFVAKDSELQEVSYYIPEGFHAEIDGNKVVIKKGEQKSAWSEEDENRLDIIFERIERGLIVDKDDIDRLKSLKNRVQPKQEWNGTEIAPPIDSDVCG